MTDFYINRNLLKLHKVRDFKYVIRILIIIHIINPIHGDFKISHEEFTM